MQIRTHRGRVAAATAVAAATVMAAGTAQAAPAPTAAPRFLSAGELPPHPSSPWYAGEVAGGLPEFPVFCLEDALPSRGARHRQFNTEFDTWAVQVTVRAASTGAARKLAAEANASVRNCAADYLEEHPGGFAEWRDYGGVAVEEGARVHGVHTSLPDAENSIHLFGVGRDGRTVTVVMWAQMGTFEHAQVDDFRKTARTAVAKLH
ncbi:hypothetical protein GCM10010420_18530 [Streptomyces glaucosporus]|uniref:Secreted protein n=1 Tax=Streptomyces glaucosporus TaxID=284044 RepID=A0ABP5V4I6_9ACTN